jgi:hypothetical protein
MNGRARLISSISGRSYTAGIVTAKAVAFGLLSAGQAFMTNPVSGSGERTRDTGLQRWLHVTPTEPQQLVWLTPQYGVDYTIETSTGLDWQIK